MQVSFNFFHLSRLLSDWNLPPARPPSSPRPHYVYGTGVTLPTAPATLSAPSPPRFLSHVTV